MLKIIMANKGVRNAKDVKSIETRLTMEQVLDAIRIQEEKLLNKSEIKSYRGK